MSSIDFSVDNPDFKEGKDYMMMTYEERSLDLDIVEAQPGHVITGVRLRKLGGHINLEVRVRESLRQAEDIPQMKMEQSTVNICFTHSRTFTPSNIKDVHIKGWCD